MTAARITSTIKSTAKHAAVGTASVATGAGLGLAGQPWPLVLTAIAAPALFLHLSTILRAAGAAAKDLGEASIRFAIANRLRKTPPDNLNIAALIDVTLNGAAAPTVAASDSASPSAAAARRTVENERPPEGDPPDDGPPGT